MTSYIHNQLTFFAKRDKKYQKLITAIGPIMNENVDLPPTYLSLVSVLVSQSYVHKYVEYIIVLSQLAKRMTICSLSIIIAERMKGSQKGVWNSGEWVRSGFAWLLSLSFWTLPSAIFRPACNKTFIITTFWISDRAHRL